MTNQTRKWIRGGLEAFITGATASISAAVGVSVIDPGNWGATTKSIKLMGVTALISGGFKFVHWWNTNPLPPEGDTGQILADAGSLVPQPVISLNPLAKVQTMSVPAIPISPPKP
jgi:hypothetical protein